MSGAVETGGRGFSFMPEGKVEVLNLQYVEGAELERTWITNRRQRLKQQEQKIWEEFVKEQDVLNSVCQGRRDMLYSVCQDDPYQFLEQLPESCLKELMEVELERMKAEETVVNIVEEEKQESGGGGDSSERSQLPEEQPTVTFAEVIDGQEEANIFHIFDNDKDDDKDDDRDNEQSGPEEEALNESTSPCTVRERSEEKDTSPVAPPRSPYKHSSKSPENVSTMIESSIYCAKIRDLRPKIANEMLAIIASLEQRDILNIDPEDLAKMRRRSSEFCARFNRIYLYQLQRQIHDIKRAAGAALPYARHTHFQSQVVRVVALHQNLLQAVQVFHKSLEQTACADEGAAMLRALTQLCAAATAACRAVPAAAGLYADAMLATCEQLDAAVVTYAARLAGYIDSTNNTNSSRSGRTGKSTVKKRFLGNWSKSSKTKTDAGSRLSMYSLDTLRAGAMPRGSSRDTPSGGTSKAHVLGAGPHPSVEKAPPKGNKKSPRRGRPLMRAPAGPKRPRPAHDRDIRTLVEAVQTCASISGEVSPRQRKTSKNTTPQRSRNVTPRIINIDSPRRVLLHKPYRPTGISPKLPSPKTNKLKSETRPAESLKPESNRGLIEPESQRVCAEIEQKSEAKSPRNAYESPKVSPRMAASPRAEEVEVPDRDRIRALNLGPARCEVTRIVRQLCGGDAAGGRTDRVTGAKNAQLHCVTGGSPRQPSTPQLLKILEETIQKKVPKSLFQKSVSARTSEVDRFRLAFNIPEHTADQLFQYRTKFVQHMLASPMYANCAIGKPWELVSSISEQLIDDLLVQCAKEMQLHSIVQELYKAETR